MPLCSESVTPPWLEKLRAEKTDFRRLRGQRLLHLAKSLIESFSLDTLTF